MADSFIWKNTITEGIVIVGSILLAFAIDAAWDSRQQNIEEQQVLIAIRSDMEKNLEEAEIVIFTTTNIFESLQNFMSSSPEMLATLSEEDAAETLFYFINISTFTAYAGSLTSNNLNLIQDLPLQNELGAWLGYAANVAENTPFDLQSMLNLQELAAPYGAMLVLTSFMELIPEEPGEQIPSPGEVLSNLRRDEVFINQLLQHVALIANSYQKVETLQTSTQNILARIDELVSE